MSDNRIVLVYEDDPKAVEVLAEALAGLPHDILLTSSADEAMKTVRSREIAVLLCDADLSVNREKAHAVMGAAREENPDVVCILASGTPEVDDLIRAINTGGVWRFVKRPWASAELVSLIRLGVARYAKLASQLPEETRKNVKQITVAPRSAQRKASHHQPGQPIVLRKSRAASRKSKPQSVHAALKNVRIRGRGQTEGVVSSRYRVEGVLGEGGMGTVYKAHDTMLGMTVAIKVLPPSLTRNPVSVETLKNEARIAMQLSHRHIVRMHNLTRGGDSYFIVMEYVDGRTLREIVRQTGPLPLDTVVPIVRVSAEALAYAHRQGVMHKDLKSDNLMIDNDGILKVIDFGISSLMDVQDADDDIMGAPSYMSPEQIRGEALDARTDIYSMGLITCEALTGVPPFPVRASVEEILSSMPADVSSLPECVRDIVARAVEPDRDRRWPEVMQYAIALERASGVNIA